MPYPTTGVASRDHVRKTFWEIFSAEADSDTNKLQNKDIVDAIENQLLEVNGNDCKTKEYRDMTKAIQLKLRGTRYVEARS